MNKLLVIYGCMILGTSLIAKEQESTVTGPMVNTNLEVIGTTVEGLATSGLDVELEEAPLLLTKVTINEPEVLETDEIAFLEIEEEVDLGFDTADYLPEGFNPYESYFDLNSIIFVEVETEELGYDTSSYLPEGFDAYAEVIDLRTINFMEEEEEIDLGFDTADYLPEGFDPYGDYKAVDAIEFKEVSNEDDLGFNAEAHLPVAFDAYTEVVNIDSIQFVEDDTIELGFDTSAYLPEGFDPHVRSTR
ncbi:hypothetical protein ABV409_07075 [Flagellimonas sp. DF-77]|uniref:hypothetical protein n=1 Tax=Flagellimonas algarum TaxID=3230298 RepID=UPI003392FAD7